MQDLLLRVSSVRTETPSTRVVRVRLNGAAFAYRAGQAAAIGPAGSDERVPYSIASAPAETSRHGLLEFLIKLHADGRWGKDFDLPRRGARMSVRGPMGSFVLPDVLGTQPLLFIAGGTGIAPLRSMIRQLTLTKRRARMRLLYSARTPDDFSYARELRALSRRHLELKLTATREWAPRWRGSRGRITIEQLRPMVDDPEILCFVCGPEPMVDDVPAILRKLGIPKSRILVEEWK